MNVKKSNKVEEEYSLITITVNKESVKNGLHLNCLDDQHIFTGMDILISWYEIIFKSHVNLHSNENEIVVSLDSGFTRKVISCKVTLNKKSLYTKEYLLSEQAKQVIEAFVTDEDFRGRRGGRLVHSNPSVMYIDGFKPMFLSVHLMNIGKPFYFNHTVRTQLSLSVSNRYISVKTLCKLYNIVVVVYQTITNHKVIIFGKHSHYNL